MEIGGVILGAGMEMDLAEGDYRHGAGRVRFMVERVVATRSNWVVLDGTERPTSSSPWRARRIEVRVAALKRSLALV